MVVVIVVVLVVAVTAVVATIVDGLSATELAAVVVIHFGELETTGALPAIMKKRNSIHEQLFAQASRLSKVCVSTAFLG